MATAQPTITSAMANWLARQAPQRRAKDPAWSDTSIAMQYRRLTCIPTSPVGMPKSAAICGANTGTKSMAALVSACTQVVVATTRHASPQGLSGSLEGVLGNGDIDKKRLHSPECPPPCGWTRGTKLDRQFHI